MTHNYYKDSEWLLLMLVQVENERRKMKQEVRGRENQTRRMRMRNNKAMQQQPTGCCQKIERYDHQQMSQMILLLVVSGEREMRSITIIRRFKHVDHEGVVFRLTTTYLTIASSS